MTLDLGTMMGCGMANSSIGAVFQEFSVCKARQRWGLPCYVVVAASVVETAMK